MTTTKIDKSTVARIDTENFGQLFVDTTMVMEVKDSGNGWSLEADFNKFRKLSDLSIGTHELLCNYKNGIAYIKCLDCDFSAKTEFPEREIALYALLKKKSCDEMGDRFEY